MKTLRNKQEEIQRLCKLLTQDQAVVFCLDASLRCLDADAAGYAAEWAASDAENAAHAGFASAASAASLAAYAAYIAADAVSAAVSVEADSIEVLKYILEGEK